MTRLVSSRPLKKAARESESVRELAQQWFAGELITDAVFLAEKLRRQGLSLSFHHLPAHGDELATVTQLPSLLRALGSGAEGVELSIKPSTMGLRVSADLARENLSSVCAAADEHDAFVTLEMQRPEEYAATLELFRAVRADRPHLGVTIPVNVRRAEADCQDLAAEGARVRVCVGSYAVPRALAVRGEHAKARALVRCLRVLMESHAHPMLATHDPRVIAIAQDLAQRNNKGRDDFEFQMMLGVRPLEQRRLVDIGFRARTYIPFGPAWYEYLATRIAARPRTLLSYGRALLDKR
ncbi:proline dehydrogenase family protein [Tessaracoccus antarcticus]|uniref:proline dehydrogenase family protein n=1 Tax=Tessaracoccus antarcticus TaxID=2479848 RepID=UPI0011C4A1C6|nr:proline dehydrogenase family protein [Tessaracoccus antarcticus]